MQPHYGSLNAGSPNPGSLNAGSHTTGASIRAATLREPQCGQPQYGQPQYGSLNTGSHNTGSLNTGSLNVDSLNEVRRSQDFKSSFVLISPGHPASHALGHAWRSHLPITFGYSCITGAHWTRRPATPTRHTFQSRRLPVTPTGHAHSAHLSVTPARHAYSVHLSITPKKHATYHLRPLVTPTSHGWPISRGPYGGVEKYVRARQMRRL